MPLVNNTDITIDELIAQFGDHYIDNGQNMDNLHMLPFESFGTAEAGYMESTDQTVIREANVRVGEVLQPYQHDFVSKGAMVILPVEIKLHHVMITTGIMPKQVSGQWVDFLVKNGIDPLEFPLIRFIIEKYLIPQAQEDLEMNAIYKGQRKEAEDGVAGLAIDSMQGIEQALVTMEAAEKIDFINTGAWNGTASTFVTQIEDFVKSIPEKYRYNESLELNLNRTNRDKFKQGMRDKYNINYNQTNNLLQLMDFENITVAGRASMMGKNRIWATPKSNLGTFVKGFENAKAFDLQKFDRQVKFLTDWWIGTGFIQPEMVFANELS